MVKNRIKIECAFLKNSKFFSWKYVELIKFDSKFEMKKILTNVNNEYRLVLD